MELPNSISFLPDYIDSIASFINRFHKIPNITELDVFSKSNTQQINELTFNNSLCSDAIDLICKSITDDYPMSHSGYSEKLTLALAASVCCDDSAHIAKLFDVLYKERSKVLSSLNLFFEKQSVSLLEKIINSCPSATRAAKDAVNDYIAKINSKP